MVNTKTEQQEKMLEYPFFVSLFNKTIYSERIRYFMFNNETVLGKAFQTIEDKFCKLC